MGGGKRKWSEDVGGRRFQCKDGKGWGAVSGEREEDEERRKSKDKEMNKEERELVKFIKKRGWDIVNGGTEGVWEGE